MTVAGPVAVNLGLAPEGRGARRDPALALRDRQLSAPAPRKRPHDPRHAGPQHHGRGARAHHEPPPDAAAIVFMLGADTGRHAHRPRALERAHRSRSTASSRSCYVVLNKIDGLRDGMKPESQVLSEIDRQVKSSAEALRRRSHARLRALGAAGPHRQDPGRPRRRWCKSRLYRLEQALARGMVHQRRLDHASADPRRGAHRVRRDRARSSTAASPSCSDQIEELVALQGKNQKLVEALARKATNERGAHRAGARGDDGPAHRAQPQRRPAREAARPDIVRDERASQARTPVRSSKFSQQHRRGARPLLPRGARARCTAAIAVINETRAR